MRIAFLGTRGVPARYGGFETAAEEIGTRLVTKGHEVVVYCRNPGQTKTTHLGMRLVNLPALKQRSLETLSHTGLSVIHSLLHVPDVAILFNAANAPYIPVLKARGIPTAVHVDGLEWKRAKWSGAGARYFRWAEGVAARQADALIADARGIADHIERAHGRRSTFIPYGAPIVGSADHRLRELDLSCRSYHLAVARFEPENNVEAIVGGYRASRAARPLVVVGGAPYADGYVERVRSAAEADRRIRFLGPLWDQELLDQLYANCLSYLHGHSVGGTNPSLLRAMGASAPVTVFDVEFNREVTGGHARFFSTPAEVRAAVEADERAPDIAVARGEAGQRRAASAYTWDDVSTRYERLASSLLDPAHDSHPGL